MDQRTRKLMTMDKALHPREEVDRLHVSRREGGRGLVSIEEIVDTSIQGHKERRGERLTTLTRNNTSDMRINRTTIFRKQTGEEKRLYGHFKQLTSEKMWTWLGKGDFKREIEFLLMVAQNSTIRTLTVSNHGIDKKQTNCTCRFMWWKTRNDQSHKSMQ